MKATQGTRLCKSHAVRSISGLQQTTAKGGQILHALSARLVGHTNSEFATRCVANLARCSLSEIGHAPRGLSSGHISDSPRRKSARQPLQTAPAQRGGTESRNPPRTAATEASMNRTANNTVTRTLLSAPSAAAKAKAARACAFVQQRQRETMELLRENLGAS